MKKYSIGNENYLVFDSNLADNVIYLHFIWGKKDFRIYLEKTAAGNHDTEAKDGNTYSAVKLEYLNKYKWYRYDKLVGHGLAHDEIRFVNNGSVRFVELPKDFYDCALDLACQVFELTRSHKGKSAS